MGLGTPAGRGDRCNRLDQAGLGSQAASGAKKAPRRALFT